LTSFLGKRDHFYGTMSSSLGIGSTTNSFD
jgi:hypothetical protein